jgi:hypothetical protein
VTTNTDLVIAYEDGVYHERQKDYRSDIDCKMVDEWDKGIFYFPSFCIRIKTLQWSTYTNFTKDTMIEQVRD